MNQNHTQHQQTPQNATAPPPPIALAEDSGSAALLHHFRSAANSIAQLYRESQSVAKESQASGYAQCLTDLYLFLSALPVVRMDNNSIPTGSQRLIHLDNFEEFFLKGQQNVLSCASTSSSGRGNYASSILSLFTREDSGILAPAEGGKGVHTPEDVSSSGPHLSQHPSSATISNSASSSSVYLSDSHDLESESHISASRAVSKRKFDMSSSSFPSIISDKPAEDSSKRIRGCPPSAIGHHHLEEPMVE